MPLTVLIVDDHAAFRRMAGRMLEEAGFDVIGEAADGDSALTLAATLRPQLVILDIQLPGLDGFAVAERLARGTAEGDGPVVVLTSSRSAADYGSRVGRSRAKGFIAKAELSGPALLQLFEATG